MSRDRYRPHINVWEHENPSSSWTSSSFCSSFASSYAPEPIRQSPWIVHDPYGAPDFFQRPVQPINPYDPASLNLQYEYRPNPYGTPEPVYGRYPSIVERSRPSFKSPRQRGPRSRRDRPTHSNESRGKSNARSPGNKRSNERKPQTQRSKETKASEGDKNNSNQRFKKPENKPGPSQKKEPIVPKKEPLAPRKERLLQKGSVASFIKGTVSEYLEKSKDLSEPVKRQGKVRAFKFFELNGIKVKSVVEQNGLFNWKAPFSMKVSFINFFPEFFSFSANGSNFDNVSLEIALELYTKCNELGLLPKEVIFNAFLKKPEYSHSLSIAGKFGIGLLKEEVDKEGLSASFCDGTASATPDELAKLQSAIQRAAERIAEKDYPDPEEVIKSSGAGNSTVDLDETEEKVEEGQGDGENNSFELTDEA